MEKCSCGEEFSTRPELFRHIVGGRRDVSIPYFNGLQFIQMTSEHQEQMQKLVAWNEKHHII